MKIVAILQNIVNKEADTIIHAICNKKVVGLLAAVVFITIFYLLPNPEGLSQEAKMAVVLLFAALILWLTEALPNGITAVLVMSLMPFFGIFTFNEAFSKFASSAFFFVMANFGMTTALAKTTIPVRASALVLKWSGTNSNMIVLGFMVIAALISTICSNIATTAMMMGFAVGILKTNHSEPGKSQLGRALMLGTAYGAFIGGCATLSGSSSHLMMLSITEEAYDFTIRFLDWIIVSSPFIFILLPVTWFSLIKLYKPEPITQATYDETMKVVKDMGKISANEKKLVIILVVMFILWIMSTWIPQLNIAAIAWVGLAVMFLPGVNILTFEEFTQGVAWNVLLVIGGVVAIAAGISSTGGFSWLIAQCAPFFANTSDFLIYAFTSVFSCLMHCIVPSGSAVAGVLTLPMMELAQMTGANATAIFHIVGWWAGTTFLLPVDSILLIVYSYGYTKLMDPLKAGIVPTLVLIILSVTISPWIITTFNIGMPM